jgi:hypothetical protein
VTCVLQGNQGLSQVTLQLAEFPIWLVLDVGFGWPADSWKYQGEGIEEGMLKNSPSIPVSLDQLWSGNGILG